MNLSAPSYPDRTRHRVRPRTDWQQAPLSPNQEPLLGATSNPDPSLARRQRQRLLGNPARDGWFTAPISDNAIQQPPAPGIPDPSLALRGWFSRRRHPAYGSWANRPLAGSLSAPLSYATSNYGVALIRRVTGSGSGGWTHVTWLNPNTDVVVDNPGVGTFDYATIVVIGADFDSSYNAIVADGRQTIVVGNIKK